MNLTGKVVLITGGRRVGGALALDLSERGAAVALTYRSSRAAIEATVAAIRDRGGSALAVEADLTLPDEAQRAVDEAARHLGRLDVLVNMVSTYRRTPFEALTPADFDELTATNLAAPYHSAIAAARRMLAQPADAESAPLKGKIINVGDWATERPYRDYLPYLVAKGALKTLTLGLARELAPHVAVNLVQPAMIEPPSNMSAADIEAVKEATPLRRIGAPEDLNRLILYLLEGTDFATGACFRVDGGRFLGRDD